MMTFSLIVVGLVCISAVYGAASKMPLKTTDAAVQNFLVKEHNRLRTINPSQDSFKLRWDDDAQKIAQAWANRCEFRHPATNSNSEKHFLKTKLYGCGQNIAMGTGDMSWNTSIKMWYDEIKNFKYGKDTGKAVGHYTAIVWAKTHKIGCGYKMCKKGTPQAFNFFVCDYCPAGNIYPNQFKPYTPGNKCAKCPKHCENGLCTNPCPKTNSLSNC